MARKKPGPPDETLKHHGNGVYSRWSARRKGWVYSIQYYWHDRAIGKARRITEGVPPDKDGICRLESAVRLKAKREKEKHAPTFKPSHYAEADRLAAKETEADRRAPLLFETAAAQFLKECSSEYARPQMVLSMFNPKPGKITKRPGPLHEAFAGRYLDEISRVDVRQYYLDRVQNEGPFTGRKGPVTRRAPEQEITFLSALYTFLQDAGQALENPCHRPRTRRKDSPLAPYKPVHEAVIPTDAALRAMLEVKQLGKDGRDLIRPEDHALVALCYFTAARPESEPCKLRHGDVELGDDSRWGAVTYHDTKTGGDRRVLLHPAADRLLRAIMKPVPMKAAEREEWKALPIFRRIGKATHWDSSSYKKTWTNILAVLVKDHPEVKGMWLRDLRKVAKTKMVDAGAPELTVNRILGHRDGVTGRYYKLTDAAMQRALETLTLGAEQVSQSAADPAAGQGSLMQYQAVR